MSAPSQSPRLDGFRSALKGSRILVTGGTGFIGGRLVERLVLECGAEVRVLVHHFARASRIARFPIEMMLGDMTEPQDVERAVQGCEVIFHCACATQGSEAKQLRANGRGTENVLASAQRSSVKRVVHVSSNAVYGITPDGDLDETAPRRPANPYSCGKLSTENAAFAAARDSRLPVVILQPTIVYGPFATPWTVNVLQQLKVKRSILVNGGEGLCNAVYVDDVTNAMLLAAVAERCVGEAFLISAEAPVTWREFYGRYEQMLGIRSSISMSAAEATAYSKNHRQTLLRAFLTLIRDEPSFRRRLGATPEVTRLRTLARLLPSTIRQSLARRVRSGGATQPQPVASPADKPIQALPARGIQLFATKTRVRIDKAKRLLGYEPAFDFETGMNLTEEWARWANLLDSRP